MLLNFPETDEGHAGRDDGIKITGLAFVQTENLGIMEDWSVGDSGRLLHFQKERIRSAGFSGNAADFF